MRFSRMFGPALAALVAAPVAAADLALVIVNSDYDRAPDLRTERSERAFDLALDRAGFQVFRGADLTGPEMHKLAGEFSVAAQADDDNRLVIVLSGHLAGSTSEGWLMGREADRPDLFAVGAQGLPLAPLTGLAGSAPGHAVVMVARPEKMAEVGAGLTAGSAPVPLPEGVTLVQGPNAGLLALLQDAILDPNTSYAEAAEAAGTGVDLTGYLSPDAGLLRVTTTDTGEIAYWSAVRDLNTVDAYQAYIDRYPSGKFIAEARDAIADLELEPERRAQADEAALNLSRDQRRVIQSNLTAIGYSTRGVDGLFGPATRRAISAWQEANGQAATGYLNRPQVAAIQAAADRKAAQLAQEERDRQAAVERADRAYWRDLGQGQDEAALRAYLNRYPRGVFADTARERLKIIDDRRAEEARREERRDWETARRNDTEAAYRDFLNRYPRGRYADEARAALQAIEDRRQEEAGREERRIWETARGQDSVAAYRDYLDRYPRGRFADEARSRIDALQGNTRDSREVAKAKREEAGLAGNPVTRLLIEQRLTGFGFNPGPVDGVFDARTRNAIRQFQTSNGLPTTGYVGNDTMALLIVGGH
ncbi:peptidoglycan-binding protein [Pseudooceanicola sp.]|uniref:peptidoglycan-binding protein n=1 Tax=Pseudooceanicola sp. TaxID=1914328 RepID=UPI002636E59F|nr:peptidoglycan-binding protein [Pseudooceanicola sp.]MDF1855697.1 peptidoglycan-binding protein [Pseudooceanicola sp.]